MCRWPVESTHKHIPDQRVDVWNAEVPGVLRVGYRGGLAICVDVTDIQLRQLKEVLGKDLTDVPEKPIEYDIVLWHRLVFHAGDKYDKADADSGLKQHADALVVVGKGERRNRHFCRSVVKVHLIHCMVCQALRGENLKPSDHVTFNPEDNGVRCICR